MLALLQAVLPQYYLNKVEELYCEYREQLLYLAYKIVKDKEASYDIVQHAFVKIIKHIKKIDGMDKYGIKGYIIFIVKNLCIDYLRRQKREKIIPYEKIAFSLHNAEEPVEDAVMLDFDIKLMNDRLKKLDEKYSLPLIMMYSLDYTHKEIADTLGITEQNARVRCFRGKKMLIEAIGKEANHDEKA